MDEKCPRCEAVFTREEIDREFKVCRKCYNEDRGWYEKHRQIEDFRTGQIGELRTMVNLSRKGKPRKQPRGFHIVK